jgi:hypothetical protein
MPGPLQGSQNRQLFSNLHLGFAGERALGNVRGPYIDRCSTSSWAWQVMWALGRGV